MYSNVNNQYSYLNTLYIFISIVHDNTHDIHKAVDNSLQIRHQYNIHEKIKLTCKKHIQKFNPGFN